MAPRKVPFMANTADNTHCVQAVFGMVLKYYVPQKEFTWERLDELTKKEPNKGTWWFPAIAELNKLGITTRYIDIFDFKRYHVEGDSYLRQYYSQEIADWLLRKSNLRSVRKLIPEFISTASTEIRAATLGDIDQLLADDWLVGVEINTRVLQNQAGFNGHMILIFDNKNSHYYAHDPGLPAIPNRKIDRQLFHKSWAYSEPEKASLIAFKSHKID